MKKPLIVFILILSMIIGGCSYVRPDGKQPPDTDSPSQDSPQQKPKQKPKGNPVKDKEPTEDQQTPNHAPSYNQSPEEKILKSMSLEEKIGQLLIIGYLQGTPEQELKEWIMERKIGGFILFKRNFHDFDSLYQTTNQLKQWNAGNKSPLFISIDEEGGEVSRLPEGATRIPDPRLVAHIDDPSLTLKTGQVIGQELAAAGINLDFAPVLDIVPNPENKLLYNRCYGGDPQQVIRHGIAFVEGLNKSGVLACGKHFPGHGNTTVDSHKNLPVINMSKEAWLQHDALPFKAAIKKGIDLLMVGHLSFPAMDPSGLPASQSQLTLNDILRNQMGYDGLIITDDIEMEGYSSGLGLDKAVLSSFKAGVDVFLICHTREKQLLVLETLKKAIQSGEISHKRLDSSVLRVLKAKAKLKDFPDYPLQEARKVFGSPYGKSVLEEINTRLKKN